MRDLDFENDKIFPEGLPDIEELEFDQLDRSHQLQIRIGYFMLSLFLFVGMIVVLAVSGQLFEIRWLLTGMGLWLALVVFYWIFSGMVYRRRQYAIRQRDVSFRSGVIVTRLTTIPFNRIQHCDISRGLVDQSLDLSKLNIYTAGGSSSDLTIPGLEEKRALRLKALILQKISADEEE